MADYAGQIAPLDEWIRQMLMQSASQNASADVNAAYAGPTAGLLQDTTVPGYEAGKWGKSGGGMPAGDIMGMLSGLMGGQGGAPAAEAAPAAASTEAPKTTEAPPAQTAPPAQATAPEVAPEGYQGITPELEERIRSKARWNAMAGISPTQTVSAALALEGAKKRDYEDKVFASTLRKYAKADISNPQTQRELAMDMITTGGDKGLQYGTQILTNLNTQERMRQSVNLQASKQIDMANLYGRNLQVMQEQPGTPAAQQAYYQNEGLRALWKTDEYTLANRAMTNPQMIGMQTFMPEVAETAAGMRGEFDPSTKLRQGSGPPRAPSDMRLDTPEQPSLSSEKPSDWRVARKALIDSKRYTMEQIDKILRREYPDYPGVK